MGFLLALKLGAARTSGGVEGLVAGAGGFGAGGFGAGGFGAGGFGAGVFGAGGLPRRGRSCDTTGNADRTGFNLSMNAESVLEPPCMRKNFGERFMTR